MINSLPTDKTLPTGTVTLLFTDYEDLFLRSPEREGEHGFLHILYGIYAAVEGNYEKACLEHNKYAR